VKVPKIELIRIDCLNKFDPEEFLADPVKHRFQGAVSGVLEKKAAELAKNVPWICIAVVNDNLGKFAICKICADGKAERFSFFNAEACGPVDAEIRMVIKDRAMDNDIIFEDYIRYSSDSVF